MEQVAAQPDPEPLAPGVAHAHAVELGAHWHGKRPVAVEPHPPVDELGWTTDTDEPW